MKRAERLECVAVILAACAALRDVPRDRRTTAAARVRRDVGALEAQVERVVHDGTLAVRLTPIVLDAKEAGGDLAGFARVRDAVARAPVVTRPGRSTAALVARYCLAMEAEIAIGTALESQDQADVLQARMMAAFDAAESEAAAALESDVWRALVALRGVVVQDIATRRRQLPRVLAWRFARARPALWVAHRLYGSADRVGDLITRNDVRHPGFMPLGGRALSN